VEVHDVAGALEGGGAGVQGGVRQGVGGGGVGQAPGAVHGLGLGPGAIPETDGPEVAPLHQGVVALRGSLPGGTAQETDDSWKHRGQGLHRSKSVCPFVNALPLGVVLAQVWWSCAVGVGEDVRAVCRVRGARDAGPLGDAGGVAVHVAVPE